MHLINLIINIVPRPWKFIRLNSVCMPKLEDVYQVPDHCGINNITDFQECSEDNESTFDKGIQGYSAAQWLFSSKPGAFGLYPGLAMPTGVILLVAISIMFLCSLPCVRRRGNFEVFYFSHLLYWVFYAALVLHAPNCYKWTIIPLFLFLVETTYKVLSMTIMSQELGGASTVQAALVLPSKVTALVIKKPAYFKHSAGDWVFLKVPAVTKFEWHPFTISSAPEEADTFTLHIRAVGGWTQKLHELVSKQQSQTNYKDVCNTPSDNKLIRRYSTMKRRPSMVRYQRSDEVSRRGPSDDSNARNGVEMMENGALSKVGAPSLKCYIDGPYGAPASNFYQASHAVLIATGIGVTPFSAILQVLKNGGNLRATPTQITSQRNSI